jgi:GMP synthase-like glutamine amidotransferase
MGSQPPPLRLGILMNDTPLPQTKAKWGSYGGVFTNLFERAVAPDPVAAHLAITMHDVVNDTADYPALEDVDCLLLTGSRHNAFDTDAWIETLVEFTRKALASGRVRVVGVCFGHQIVGRALGVPVTRSPGGWELSVTDVALTEKGKEIFGMDKMVSRISQRLVDGDSS